MWHARLHAIYMHNLANGRPFYSCLLMLVQEAICTCWCEKRVHTLHALFWFVALVIYMMLGLGNIGKAFCSEKPKQFLRLFVPCPRSVLKYAMQWVCPAEQQNSKLMFFRICTAHFYPGTWLDISSILKTSYYFLKGLIQCRAYPTLANSWYPAFGMIVLSIAFGLFQTSFEYSQTIFVFLFFVVFFSFVLLRVFE